MDMNRGWLALFRLSFTERPNYFLNHRGNVVLNVVPLLGAVGEMTIGDVLSWMFLGREAAEHLCSGEVPACGCHGVLGGH